MVSVSISSLKSPILLTVFPIILPDFLLSLFHNLISLLSSLFEALVLCLISLYPLLYYFSFVAPPTILSCSLYYTVLLPPLFSLNYMCSGTGSKLEFLPHTQIAIIMGLLKNPTLALGGLGVCVSIFLFLLLDKCVFIYMIWWSEFNRFCLYCVQESWMIRLDVPMA